jgi:N-dimethylarginine dimethylaminohydrolase
VGNQITEAETQDLKEKLTEFYQEHFEPLVGGEILNYLHLNTMLTYVAEDVITMYENNIKQHFCKYVGRFINVVHLKNTQIEAIKASDSTTEQKKERIKSLNHELRRMKNDILNVKVPKTSDTQCHTWNERERINIKPQRTLIKQSVYYEITCRPQDYLPMMIYMMK